jgi:hypothetical protein
MVDASLDPSHPMDAPVSICCRIDANDRSSSCMSPPLPLAYRVAVNLMILSKAPLLTYAPIRPSLLFANFPEKFLPTPTLRDGEGYLRISRKRVASALRLATCLYYKSIRRLRFRAPTLCRGSRTRMPMKCLAASVDVIVNP